MVERVHIVILIAISAVQLLDSTYSLPMLLLRSQQAQPTTLTLATCLNTPMTLETETESEFKTVNRSFVPSHHAVVCQNFS
jgi:hypothetical protein